MPKKPPAYQHYAKDWLTDTAHLSLEEQGAYQRLLDHQWIEGPLEYSEADFARLLGVPRPAFRRIWRRVARFFPALESGRLANGRLEDIRTDLLAFQKGQSVAGKRGAKKRWAGDKGRHAEPIGQPIGEPIGEPNGGTMALLSSPSGTTTLPTVAAEPQGISPSGVVAGMIRKHCYPPDGKEPQGHDIARDIRWWNVRVAKYQDSVGRLEMALKGAPLVVEKLRGVKWSPAKMFTKQGEWVDLFERSVTAAGKDRKATKGPLPIGAILNAAQEKARQG